MKRHITLILVLIMTFDTVCSNRFFISAPNVFHVGVNEKVFVQMGKPHLNNPVTLYLEHEISGTLMSTKKTVQCTAETDIKTVELTINRETMSILNLQNQRNPYLLLVAESNTFTGRKSTRVLLSQHRGYIFIQTDQPMYKPTQNVHYRIFTLDHTFRPFDEVFHLSVYNAAGNRVIKTLKTAKGGILKGLFAIPDISKLGTWKITAHYEGDEGNAVSREFKVQKFVLPSFEVNIAVEENYVLLNNNNHFNFTISATYSHGEKVKGAYHCQFGVVEKAKTHGENPKLVFVSGLELTGSIKDGNAEVSQNMAKINDQLQKEKNQTLSDLQQSGKQLYLKVFVTNIQSGEIQEAEVYLPVLSHKYAMDLSRTRSYFLPGYPLDVVVVMRLPDGSPAADVQVNIDVSGTTEGSVQQRTDQEGAVFYTFNIATGASEIPVKVTAEGLQQVKIIRRASSPSNSYLYMSITNRVHSVKESLTVTYHTTNGPNNGYIYYMVLSRGIIIKNGSHPIGRSIRDNLQITADMVPSFRLIAYLYNQNGEIVADSVWVDVRDECEIKVKVEQKGPSEPGIQTKLEVDLGGATAKVALLAVDKAFYALKADNKLTEKQVFSAMQSYDLGCTYGGGRNPASVLRDAGLAFVSHSQSEWRQGFPCDSQSARRGRSVDLQQEMMALQSNFSDETLKECCGDGLTLIPMTLTCQERAERVSLVRKNKACTDAFLQCCIAGERLRHRKIQEDALKGLGRTATAADIEDFFLDTTLQKIRRLFPPSFTFKEFDANGRLSVSLPLPDSITTWEIQVITLSPTAGLCVVKPSEVRAFKDTFVSLRLPYSVRKYEQISISPVIYNYGQTKLRLAVHMAQAEGLCSPGSATTSSYVNIVVEPHSSQFVTFSAVPMVTGSIPIKIRVFDIENENAVDAIEKTLNVWTEGVEQRIEATHVIKLNAMSPKSLKIDGTLPDEIIPDSTSNIFVSVEENGFSFQAVNLLSAEKVASLIVLPTGCLEQTMVRLAPTAAALRYLDLSGQWFNLPPGSRDDALDKIEKGYLRIFDHKKPNGAYGTFYSVPTSSNWVTALVVKVLSFVAQRQTAAFGEQGRTVRVVRVDKITESVRYLLSQQSDDGSFTDPEPVLHRGVLVGEDHTASMTAFITLALHHSIRYVQTGAEKDLKASISNSTMYLMSNLEELQHPYAIAITAYCLSVCLPEGTDLSAVWTRLKAKATEREDGCCLWTTDTSTKNQERADAITVETTAYALLTAVTLKQTQWADKAACWLVSQENYFGGYRASQDTIMALEALAEYDLKKSISPETNFIAEFTVPGRNDIVTLELEKRKKVEKDLRKLSGNKIDVKLSGEGEVKLKIVKAFHVLDLKDRCADLSLSVTVEGKVKYTDKVIETYDYYDDYDANEAKEARVPRSAIEWFDAHTRSRRDLDNNAIADDTVTYTVCVSHSPDNNLTGMGIADITLLSGFEANTGHLDNLKQSSAQYISHYEISYGRVLIYFNKLLKPQECISFDATQTVPIGLLQPAPAVFYDYYEPDRKCTVFYSAPQRSRMVSRLCSGDVCQCAERPCHKIKMTFNSERNKALTKNDRVQHACFFPTVDYAYIVEVLSVSMKSNFELYNTTIKEVLRLHEDNLVDENSFRIFAKRRHCKQQLNVGKQYLIMGKDGTTTDSNGMMQYLLESNTWVEKKPSVEECQRSAHQRACRGFNVFMNEYRVDGCRQ